VGWRLQWQEKSAEAHLMVELLIPYNPLVGRFATGYHKLFINNNRLYSHFAEIGGLTSSLKGVLYWVIRD
jgi:hypothetical protein